MGRTTIEELRSRRLNAMTKAERAEFDEALAAARLAVKVGEKVRQARPSEPPDRGHSVHAGASQ